ncbi:uncharacterized protein JCM6883_002739 [Sporobolomyces salmoneus]|uniref:uncharacterized protein n=1 Tax=Sporobolomyces salmoneus TaxID=183962 RepID=UPI00317094D0
MHQAASNRSPLPLDSQRFKLPPVKDRTTSTLTATDNVNRRSPTFDQKRVPRTSSASASSSFRFPPSPSPSVPNSTTPSPTDTIRPTTTYLYAPRPPSPALSVASKRGPLPPTPKSPSPFHGPRSRQTGSPLRQQNMAALVAHEGQLDMRAQEEGGTGSMRERTAELPDIVNSHQEYDDEVIDSVPEYVGTEEDPFSDERGTGGGEKARLMETLRARRAQEDDAEASRSAEIGARDHLERWKNEQTSLDEKEIRRVPTELDRQGPRQTRSGTVSFSGGSGISRRDGTFEDGSSLVGMSDAEIAQHHFRLAQQHLEAAQRLALSASQGPAPSAPPPPSSSSHEDRYSSAREEDTLPFSSTSSTTDHTESSFGGSTEDSSISHGAYRSTYSHPPQRQHHLAHQSSQNDLYSEFGQLRLEATNSFPDEKRSRSYSNSASSPIPLSSISEKAPPLPHTLAPGSRLLSVSPRFSSLPLAKSPTQQYPSRRSPPPSQLARRLSTAEPATTPRTARQTIRRPSTADQTTPRAAVLNPPAAPHSLQRIASQEGLPTMVPSLYGGTLPQGMRDRIGTIPPPAQSTYCSASSSSSHSDPRYDRTLREREDAFEYESILGGGGGRQSSEGYEELDDIDDSASDYHDVQSTISHVTNATLPPYEYERRMSRVASEPPPVPSIPLEFRQQDVQPIPRQRETSHTSSLRSQASFSSAMSFGSVPPATHLAQNQSSSSRTRIDEDEFHGFRPRLGGSGYSHAQPSVPYPITQSAQWVPPPSRHASSEPPQAVHAPPLSLTSPGQLQPHSYILGADGRPIPVYASLPNPPPPSFATTPNQAQTPTTGSYQYSSPSVPLPPVSRQPLPIHSRPLEFDHSIHLVPRNRQTIPTATATQPERPTLSIPSTQHNPPPPTTSHAYHLPPPSTFTQPVQTSLSIPSISETIPSPSTTPSSTSSEHSSTDGAGYASSIIPFMKRNRLTSSTGMSLRRMVRSPHVRFKSPEPSIAETMTIDERLGGGQGGGEEEREERNQKAMKQSLGMLM